MSEVEDRRPWENTNVGILLNVVLSFVLINDVLVQGDLTGTLVNRCVSDALLWGPIEIEGERKVVLARVTVEVAASQTTKPDASHQDSDD